MYVGIAHSNQARHVKNQKPKNYTLRLRVLLISFVEEVSQRGPLLVNTVIHDALSCGLAVVLKTSPELLVFCYAGVVAFFEPVGARFVSSCSIAFIAMHIIKSIQKLTVKSIGSVDAHFISPH